MSVRARLRLRRTCRGFGLRAWVLGLGVVLFGAACALPEDPLEIEPVRIAEGESRFDLKLARGVVPGSLRVSLDDREVEVGAGRRAWLGGRIPLVFSVAGGDHVINVRARFMSVGGFALHSKRFSFFVPDFTLNDDPELVSSWPKQGTTDVARSEWIQFEFSAPPSKEMLESFALSCAGQSIGFDLHRNRANFVLLNPRGRLPGAARCSFDWTERGAARRFVFATAVDGPPAWIEYDREQPGLSSPFPDDYFTRSDPESATRLRLQLPVVAGPSALDGFASRLTLDLESLDGWSPVGHLFVSLSDAVDPASLPQSGGESVHPASALQLLDVDPRSDRFGQRLPFEAESRVDFSPGGKMEHSLLVFPLLPARPGGRYALIATRALRAAPGRPFEPSAFMRRVLAGPRSDETEAVTRARQIVRSTLWVAQQVASPPIPRDDIALAVRFTAGTLSDLPNDLLHVRRQLGVRPPPTFSIDRLERESGAVEVIASGTWQAPRWRKQENFARDVRGGPVIEGTKPVAFTLALPRERRPGGAPVVIYQHGNPGNAADEVPIEARRGLAEAGFAVLGFTDVFNRELGRGATDEFAILNQLAASLVALERNRRLPDYWLQTNAEQLAFVRLAEALGEVDVLPLGAPDGVPDLDLEAPLAYLGMSEGANHAPAFLAYAPEVHAAALVVGGAPIAESLTHQIDSAGAVEYTGMLMQGRGRDLWLALSLLQTAIDRQDPIHHARYLYRDPFEVDGTSRKASLLLIAGVEDRRIPNRFTDALAWLLGPLPMLEPVPRDVPFLARSAGPIRGNIAGQATAAYVQIVPAGIVGAAVAPDCDPESLGLLFASDGHYCAQIAPASIEQRRLFFLSALEDRAPVIENVLDAQP